MLLGQSGGRLEAVPKFVWFPLESSSLEVTTTCVSVSTPFTVVLPEVPNSLYVNKWEVTAQDHTSVSRDFDVHVLTLAGPRRMDGIGPLEGNNVTFTLVLWSEISAIIVFKRKMNLLLPKCQV